MSITTYIKAGQAQQRLADAGTVTSLSGTAWAWLGHATDIMQFIVLVISAAAGVASAYYYINKARRERKEAK